MIKVKVFIKYSNSDTEKKLLYFLEDNIAQLNNNGYIFIFSKPNRKQQKRLKENGAERLPCVNIEDHYFSNPDDLIGYFEYSINSKNQAKQNDLRKLHSTDNRRNYDFRDHVKGILDTGDNDKDENDEPQGPPSTKTMEEQMSIRAKRQRSSNKGHEDKISSGRFKRPSGNTDNKFVKQVQDDAKLANAIQVKDEFDIAMQKKVASGAFR